MTKTKHTPGPWTTGALMTRVEVLPKGWRMPMLIADCHGKHAPENESERVSNAKLIAAAPDLLAALIECEKRLRLGYSEKFSEQECERMCPELKLARAVIEKATT